MDWLHWLIISGVIVCSVLGVLLTAATLPGIWFMILMAALAQWWSLSGSSPSGGLVGTSAAGGVISPGGTAAAMFSWWTLGIASGLALLAEIVEFGASALGAQKAGGTRRGAIGSIIGGLVGAIAGSLVVPILGTIIGAALGAGIGAIILERHDGRKTWKDATKVGAGAAAGRFVATIAKVTIACVVAAMLIVDAIV